jgi:Bacterial membrane protein YfhO
VLMQFAAAALAAFGIDHLHEERPSPWVRYARISLVVFGVVTLALCLFVMLGNRLTFPADDRVILTAFLALILAALLLPRFSTPIPLILLLLFELGNIGQIDLLHQSGRNGMQWLDKLKGNADIAEFIRRQPGFPRAEVANDLFAANWSAWHGVEMNGGMAASVTYNVMDSEFFAPAGHRIWGIVYTISDKPDQRYGDPVFTGASGLKVYRRNAFARAWAVHELIPVTNRAEGGARMSGDADAYAHKAFLTAPAPRVESCDAAEKVELIEHLPDRLAIRADLACTGMVVLSDTFYPGWRARVDHQPAQIYEVNGAMRGVVVPKGEHTITMRYRPWSVYAGAALTLIGVVAAVVLARR